MADSSRHRGWKYDHANTRLEAFVDGVEALRLAKSSDGADFTILGDTPASYYLHFDASGPRLQIPSGVELDIESGATLTVAGTLTATDKIDSAHYAADSIDKEHLASEIYAIEHVSCLVSAADNETLGITKVWSDCTVVRVVYWTSGALGSGAGIDILDGGTAGTGTTVIDSCSDNLSGFDSNDLTTPHALSAGDYIRIKFDDFTTAPDYISVDIQLKVPLGDAT